MRYSEMFLPTGREVPSDAEVISQQLMIRAGMIRKLISGIYSYLPLGYRVIRKLEQIIREEMNKAGAQEVHMPMVQPTELWQESGRWEHYGKELLRFRDRHDHEYCLGPTHEEVITSLVRNDIKTYRQLPRNLYQIQTKFRDEVRPRFGVMRCREFGMKDAYSFDVDEEGAEKSYEKMFAAYNNIFRRCGLKFRPVEADSGSIGGKYSHEFMVMAESGEDAMVFCKKCSYAANLEKAPRMKPGDVDVMGAVTTIENARVDPFYREKLTDYRMLPINKIYQWNGNLVHLLEAHQFVDKDLLVLKVQWLNETHKAFYLKDTQYQVWLANKEIPVTARMQATDGTVYPSQLETVWLFVQGYRLSINNDWELKLPPEASSVRALFN